MKILLYLASFFVGAHGLAHFVGFIGSWRLGDAAQAAYKTTLLGGRWDVGELGMKIMGILWLIAGVAFLVCAVGLVMRANWASSAMIGSLVLSMALILLDWAPAFRGAYVNAVIVVVYILSYLVSGRGTVQ